jgi:glutamate synthase domain-containing protein 2/ferredoxin
MKPDAVVIKTMPSRFKHQVPKYRVTRSDACINCGMCAKSCQYGVHERIEGHNRIRPPIDYKCIGYECRKNDEFYCVYTCPRKALSLSLNPMYETLGDCRWTSDMIVATWIMAETGYPPERTDIDYQMGNSGGGFDKLRLKFPENPPKVERDAISTDLRLNRRNDGRADVVISTPVYGGGMSFGSVSLSTMLSKARCASIWNTFTCTGEGGYPEMLHPYDDHVITQVATGLFGVREETIQRSKIVEFKYAQGAKPGLGGHLLGEKNTESVARMREAVQGASLFSPFPFHSVYSIEDHKKHIDWVKQMNPKALVSVKVSTPNDVDMVAVGSYYAGAHIIHIDGGYGGTGAAPDIAKKNIAMPIEYAIPRVHSFLKDEGARDVVTLIASGGIRSAHDLVKALCLGADGAVIGTAELIALECVRCGNCESGRGCARGIASTDSELADLFDDEWATQRLVNLYHAWNVQLVDILQKFGMKSVTELVGRTDLLEHVDYR